MTDIIKVGQNSCAPGVQHYEFLPDQLIAGDLQIVTDAVTVTGGPYKRGAVLGMIAESGKYTLSKPDASDGSEKPCAILVDHASAGDVLAGIYQMGQFNQHRIIYAEGWTVEKLKAALRPFGIFLRDAERA
ncbi:MAG: head decoration protein [Enterobacteriaceae bacterium]